MLLQVSAGQWYETIAFADGVTLIHEPWIKPFYRCNMWHVRGGERDLLFDTGLGHFSLSAHVPLVTERPITCVASHTHFDHIGCHHEFGACSVHLSEAHILTDPRNDWTLADRYATDEMFDRMPEGWSTAAYQVRPAKLGRAKQLRSRPAIAPLRSTRKPHSGPVARIAPFFRKRNCPRTPAIP